MSTGYAHRSMTAQPAPVKPRLRGVFHELGFYTAVGLGLPLTLTAEPGRGRLYHRPTWSPRIRSRLARVDHAGVYLLIAGTYTPFGLLVLSPGWAIPVLAIVWSGVLAAIVLKLAWSRQPKRVSAGIGIALGWVGAAAFSQLLKLPTPGLLLVVAGGLAYTLGGLTYALRRPDPIPHVFGYHEVFHALTLLAVGCQYGAIAFYVLPRA
jgi:hemolysin III